MGEDTSGEHEMSGIGYTAKNAMRQGTAVRETTIDRVPGQETLGKTGGGGEGYAVDHTIGQAVGTIRRDRFVGMAVCIHSARIPETKLDAIGNVIHEVEKRGNECHFR